MRLLKYFRSCVALTAIVLLAGCAVTYTDADGARHVVGFVAMEIAPPEGNLAGEVVRVRTIGISALNVRHTVGFTLGYQDVQLASFKDHALALGPFTLDALGKR